MIRRPRRSRCSRIAWPVACGGSVPTSLERSASSSARSAASSRRVASWSTVDPGLILDRMRRCRRRRGRRCDRRVSAAASTTARTGGSSGPTSSPAERRVAGHPLDPTHQLGQRDGARRGAGGRVRGPGELVAQQRELGRPWRSRASRSDRAPAWASASRATADSVGRQRRRRLSCHGVGPDQQAGRDAERRRQGPAQQPGADGGGGLGHRDRQHEEQERRGRCGRDLRRDDPGKEHGEPDQRHGDDGGHLVGRGGGAERR